MTAMAVAGYRYAGAPARSFGNGPRPASAQTTAAAEPSGSTTAPTGSGSRTDFTSMTRKQLFDWMNGEIKRGAMTFDESSAFLGMTMSMPVGSAPTGQTSPDANERVDFFRIAQAGLAGARSRGDDKSAALLQAALLTMGSRQGSATIVDRSV